jgi:H+/Cl- antiporter ClcA
MSPSPHATATPLDRLTRHARLALLAALSGTLVGVACWAFLESLDWATRTRLAHDRLVWLLPVAGLLVGLVYHRFGGRSSEGTGLLLKEIHEPTAWVPRRLAPLVGAAAVVSHLFGASVGREGTALQMAGSLTDLVNRTFRVTREDRRVLLVAALGGGFGAVFGAPWAGLIFGLEVQWVRRLRLRGVVRWTRERVRRGDLQQFDAVDRDDEESRPVPGDDLATPTIAGRARATPNARLLAAVVPTAIAAWVGATVVAALGYHEGAEPPFAAALDLALVARAVAIGAAAGLAALLFVAIAEGTRRRLGRAISWSPLRPFVGGIAVLGLAAIAGHRHLGLSLPIMHEALAGGSTGLSVPAWKLVITALCLGSGFVGGEVTPMFVIGAALGGAVGDLTGIDPAVGAALGFAAMFAGAANTPVACTVLAVELFGADIALPAATACLASFVVSGRWGLYHHRPSPGGASGRTTGPAAAPRIVIPTTRGGRAQRR